MDKDVKITGSMNYFKFKEMSEDEKKDFVKKDAERIMNNHVEAHENDEEPHYYNKEDWYSIKAEYTLVDSYYNHKGTINASLAYNYNAGAKIKKVEYKSA